MGDFDDFDSFVEKHKIKDDELGAAFAAWLSGKGWDGDFDNVGPSEELGVCDTCGKPYELASRDGRCGDCGNCGECCDHVTGSWIPTGAEDDEMWLEFTYCPKCGEKL